METPRLFDNLYGKSFIDIMDSVPNYHSCGYGFKGWNDPCPTNNKSDSFIFYSYGYVLAIDVNGKLSLFKRSTKAWSSI